MQGFPSLNKCPVFCVQNPSSQAPLQSGPVGQGTRQLRAFVSCALVIDEYPEIPGPWPVHAVRQRSDRRVPVPSCSSSRRPSAQCLSERAVPFIIVGVLVGSALLDESFVHQMLSWEWRQIRFFRRRPSFRRPLRAGAFAGTALLSARFAGAALSARVLLASALLVVALLASALLAVALLAVALLAVALPNRFARGGLGRSGLWSGLAWSGLCLEQALFGAALVERLWSERPCLR